MATDIVTITTAAGNAMVVELNDEIGTGATSNGRIEILNGSDNVLVTIELNAPEFTDSGNVLTMSGTPTDPDGVAPATPAGGTLATTFRLFSREASPTEIFRGSVGATGSSEAMELSSTTINPGDTVEMVSGSSTITQPLA